MPVRSRYMVTKPKSTRPPSNITGVRARKAPAEYAADPGGSRSDSRAMNFRSGYAPGMQSWTAEDNRRLDAAWRIATIKLNQLPAARRAQLAENISI